MMKALTLRHPWAFAICHDTIGRVRGVGRTSHSPLHIVLLENTDMRKHRSLAPLRTQTSRTISEGDEKESPVIGEIRDAKALGYKGYAKYIWTPCADCKSGRWVQRNHAKYRGFRCKSCAQKLKGISLRGEKGSSWKGGRLITRRGYIALRMDRADVLHSMVNQNGYVLEHRLVMARHIGRSLTSDEVVHHINGNKQDNRIENLQLMTKKEHAKLHSGELGRLVLELESRIAALEAENRLLRGAL